MSNEEYITGIYDRIIDFNNNKHGELKTNVPEEEKNDILDYIYVFVMKITEKTARKYMMKDISDNH